ncbi:hypothetical protein K7X08_022248 [Anisodus acutangulus]|uniref:Uncharacterized protein n=1 Tax=Anisodus acutangulus TaxID=402998 RepID=A0A9Q1QX94_9SOLA|nr:hypothetical protein K7X08_022248 [Anisodus acutangulus]
MKVLNLGQIKVEEGKIIKEIAVGNGENHNEEDRVTEAGALEKVAALGSIEDQYKDMSNDNVIQDLYNAEVIIEDHKMSVEVALQQYDFSSHGHNFEPLDDVNTSSTPVDNDQERFNPGSYLSGVISRSKNNSEQ